MTLQRRHCRTCSDSATSATFAIELQSENKGSATRCKSRPPTASNTLAIGDCRIAETALSSSLPHSLPDSQTAPLPPQLVDELSDLWADILVAEFLADFNAEPAPMVDSPGGMNHETEHA